jgi:hypothetical protein
MPKGTARVEQPDITPEIPASKSIFIVFNIPTFPDVQINLYSPLISLTTALAFAGTIP